MAIKQWQIDLEVQNVGKASPYYGQQTGAKTGGSVPSGSQSVKVTLPGGKTGYVSTSDPGYKNLQSIASQPVGQTTGGSLTPAFQNVFDSIVSGAGRDTHRQTSIAGQPTGANRPIDQLAGYSGRQRTENISTEVKQMLSMLDTVMGALPKRTTPDSKGTAPNFASLLGTDKKFDPQQFAKQLSSNNVDLYTQKKGVSQEQWEIPQNEQWRMTQDFKTHGNRAVDVRADQGSPIPAPVFGKVVATDQDYPDYHWSYGNMVVIEDPNGVRHLIAHMDGPSQYRTGDTVWPGDIVGAVGRSGRYVDQGGGGYHLHYEAIDPSGNRIDPTPYAQGYYIQPTSGYYAMD